MKSAFRLAPVVAAALLALWPARASAQQSDATSVDAAILDVLLARGLIDKEQYDELLAMARAKADESRGEVDLIEGRLARLRAPDVQTTGGAPGKLMFKSPDGKWSMNVSGRVQARLDLVNSTDNANDGDNFSVPRARVNLAGNSGAENVKYRLEFDLNTNKNLDNPAQTGTVTLRQGWVDWGFENGSGVLLGQTEFPFGREALTSSANQQFGERSIVFTEFEPEYEPLAMWHATANEDTFEFQAAVANGEGRGKNNTPGTDNNGLRKGVRGVWNVFGAMKTDGPAFQTYDTGDTKLSLGLDYMTNDDSSGLNTVTPGANTRDLDYELQAFSGPFSLTAERITRVERQPAGANVDDSGYIVEGGWLFTPVWEICARKAAIDYDTKDDKTETAVGLNYYVDKHNGKWQMEWNRQDQNGDSPSQTLWRIGYQIMF